MANRRIAFLGASGIGSNAFLKYHCRIGLLLQHGTEIVARRWMVTPFKGAGDAVMLAAATILEEFPGEALLAVTTEANALGYFKDEPFKKIPAAHDHLTKLRSEASRILLPIYHP